MERQKDQLVESLLQKIGDNPMDDIRGALDERRLRNPSDNIPDSVGDAEIKSAVQTYAGGLLELGDSSIVCDLPRDQILQGIVEAVVAAHRDKDKPLFLAY